MNAPDVLARAAAEDGRHYYPHPPLHETAIVHGLKLLVEKRERQREEARALIEGIKKDLRGGRRAPWEQKRDALARIRAWEAGE